MKMRKLLPLVLLAVGALFLLSSCDAMLDAIFPSNQIYVDVEVSGRTTPIDWFGTVLPWLLSWNRYPAAL